MRREQLKDQCEAEFENIQAVLEELRSIVRPGKTAYAVAELAAIATFLHNAYNGVENVLKRILYYKNMKLRADAAWHKDLLKTASDIGIISNSLHAALSDYLSFRHFFVHAYSFTLRWEELKPLADKIEEIFAELKAAVISYIETA